MTTTDPSAFSSSDEPQTHDNAPGNGTIAYRYGTHTTILRRLLSRLQQQEIPGDKITAPTRPLQMLSIHDRDDAAIMLLDTWAVVADVLSFYQERIANEGYLRTAIEDRSILELSRTIGYELRPGVAASTPLVFTVEDTPGSEPQVLVPQGTPVQSIPTRPGEVPQTFETVEDLQARVEWNVLTPYVKRQLIDQTLLSNTTVKMQGSNLSLQPGDPILIIDQERIADSNDSNSNPWYLRTLTKVEPNIQENYTLISWSETIPDPPANPQIFAFRQRAALFGYNAPLTNQQLNGGNPVITVGFKTITSAGTTVTGTGTSFTTQIRRGDILIVGNQARTVMVVLSDMSLTVEAGFNPEITEATSFSYISKEVGWTNFKLQTQTIDLDTIYSGVLTDSWIVLRQKDQNTAGQSIFKDGVYQVKNSFVVFRADFGLSGRITQIKTDTNLGLETFDLRKTAVFLQSEKLKLFQEVKSIPAIRSERGKTAIALNSVTPPLKPGQTLIISGHSQNAIHNEIVTVEKTDNTDQHTVLTIRETLQNTYDPETLKIYANVVLATHGETIADEVLGSGDGTRTNQQFMLKKPPLTCVSATTGIQSTLKLYVNQVRWQQVQSLHNQDARSQCYVVQTNEQGQTRIIFGDGIRGARLPSGQENVRATYRSGIGRAGAVKAGSLILLQNRPLGIREVTNPLPAQGAADRDTFNTVRQNAPRTVLTLNHVVSLRDYENFARSFPGVGKAQATLIWTGEQRQIYITVTDADGEEAPSVLCGTLQDAMILAGSTQPVEVVSYQSKAGVFNLAANVLIDSRYRFELVKPQIEQALQMAFSFSQREFGQGVAASEIVQIIQSVEGVVAVDLDALYLVGRAEADQVKSLESFLSAEVACWDREEKAVKPAQILRLNTAEPGIFLKEWR